MSVVDDFDLQDPQLVANPYDVFVEMRKANNLLWLSLIHI